MLSATKEILEVVVKDQLTEHFEENKLAANCDISVESGNR